MKSRGISIAELLVTISIMGLMFTMIATMSLLIKKTYVAQNSFSSMQQSAAVALAKLSRELMESSYDTITIYNPSDPNQFTGIIFGSARNYSNYNNFTIDPSTAKPIWFKYIGYYIDNDPKSSGEKVLCRREYWRDTVGGTSGSIIKAPCSLNISSFITGGSDYTKRMIVAYRVKDFNFPDIPSFGNFAPSAIKNYLPLKVDIIVVERGNSPTTGYNSINVSFMINIDN